MASASDRNRTLGQSNASTALPSTPLQLHKQRNLLVNLVKRRKGFFKMALVFVWKGFLQQPQFFPGEAPCSRFSNQCAKLHHVLPIFCGNFIKIGANRWKPFGELAVFPNFREFFAFGFEWFSYFIALDPEVARISGPCFSCQQNASCYHSNNIDLDIYLIAN